MNPKAVGKQGDGSWADPALFFAVFGLFGITARYTWTGLALVAIGIFFFAIIARRSDAVFDAKSGKAYIEHWTILRREHSAFPLAQFDKIELNEISYPGGDSAATLDVLLKDGSKISLMKPGQPWQANEVKAAIEDFVKGLTNQGTAISAASASESRA